MPGHVRLQLKPQLWLQGYNSRATRTGTTMLIILLGVLLLCVGGVKGSIGDKQEQFKTCILSCIEANCDPRNPTPIPFHRRILLWTYQSECDYICQHIMTDERLARDPPYLHPVVQYHGKWPFYRFLGIQEPFSVLFSLLNYLAHLWGLEQVRQRIPASYPLRKWYLGFGYFGLASWMASMIFHTRDFVLTERADYFAAGASVMYMLYLAPIRIFRLDSSPGVASASAVNTGKMPPLLHAWTLLCLALYTAHVCYLTFWTWDYGYNMTANIAVGVVQNILWTGFSYVRYRRSGRLWQAWPGMIVAWIVLAMSMEILDFVPWNLMVDAHSLWHLGTVGPTLWWYSFLIKDASEDLQASRLKD